MARQVWGNFVAPVVGTVAAVAVAAARPAAVPASVLAAAAKVPPAVAAALETVPAVPAVAEPAVLAAVVAVVAVFAAVFAPTSIDSGSVGSLAAERNFGFAILACHRNAEEVATSRNVLSDDSHFSAGVLNWLHA